VSLNTDIDRLEKTIEAILTFHPTAEIMLAVSLVTFEMPNERMNKGVLNVYSDKSVFYKGSQLGMPDLSRFDTYRNVQIASHGFIHVDHRLLAAPLVEWNIIQSCSIICPDEKTFVPPRHKWDEDVERICLENDVTLIKVEDGWAHLSYHNVKEHLCDGYNFYFHTYDFDSNEELREQLTKAF
jgi:hypothetical protein